MFEQNECDDFNKKLLNVIVDSEKVALIETINSKSESVKEQIANNSENLINCISSLDLCDKMYCIGLLLPLSVTVDKNILFYRLCVWNQIVF